MSTTDLHTTDDDVASQISIYCGEEERLLNRADRAATPTELVLAPTELHQRNLQRRLRERTQPQNAFEFVDPKTVAEVLLGAADPAPTSLDRVDRLALLQSLPTETADQPSGLRPLLAARRDVGPQQLEQIRSEVESMTNFHPDRIAALRDVTDEFATPIADEATTLVDGGLAVETWLRNQTDKAVSKTALLRRATRRLIGGDEVWTDCYPDIERISLVGVSSIPAPEVDFLYGLCTATTADIELHLRPGTSEYLTMRLPDLLSIDYPGREVNL
ncbi:hypothetical protein PM033_14885 [Halorubrum ezzemoulense]|uniref:hypothetical protein n=1 Tax=Halorubrum ezzemoulense TaxID=337243 RepID=UPI00232E79FF|nr:hypothetical protein [Halorubrum ezzemoulense]MDB2253030.1 hypothetical protein [Halorubrum ezzemoulense]